MAAVDPITRSVVQHRLSSIVAEMGEAMLRTSYSQILNSSRDFSIAICDTQDEKDTAISAQTPFVRRLQRRIDAVHNAYTPYFTVEPHFQMEAAPRGLGVKFRFPPTIDQQFLERLLSYVRKQFWDAKKQKSHLAS